MPRYQEHVAIRLIEEDGRLPLTGCPIEQTLDESVLCVPVVQATYEIARVTREPGRLVPVGNKRRRDPPRSEWSEQVYVAHDTSHRQCRSSCVVAAAQPHRDNAWRAIARNSGRVPRAPSASPPTAPADPAATIAMRASGP